jgi:hypothetical protein
VGGSTPRRSLATPWWPLKGRLVVSSAADGSSFVARHGLAPAHLRRLRSRRL